MIGLCLWLDFSNVDRIRAIDGDIAQKAVVSCETEYAVEKPPFSLGQRRAVWIVQDGEEMVLTQYRSTLSSGDVGIGTVVYAESSRIVLSLDGAADDR